MTRLRHIRQILWGVLVLNLLVAMAKWGYGILTHSVSMQADGLHSLFDGLSNVVGLLGVWLASPPPDARHPYGHKKFESLSAGIIAGFLLLTAGYLLVKAYRSWTLQLQPDVTMVSFVIMGLTIVVNLVVTGWERKKGKELKSEILRADSYHTASDVLTSLAVIAGLLAVQVGYPLVDPLVAILIAGVIVWTAYVVLKDVLASLTDQNRLVPEDIRKAVMTLSGILECHEIRTRGLAHHVFVDLSIHVDPAWSVEQAHALATEVEDLLLTQFEAIEDVLVHVEPDGH